MQPNQYQQNPFQYPAAQPAPAQGHYQPAQGPYQPAGIAPQGAGAPVPAPVYGQSTQYGTPVPQYAAPAPGPVMPFGDPYAAVATASLTRGQKLFLRAEDVVLAELLGAKLVNGQKGLAQVFELRVFWSEKGANVVGSEPSVVLKQGHYFGPEIKTWMCALLGIVAGRDQAAIAQIDGTPQQWSKLCALASSSGDNQLNGPGPFVGTFVRLDCYKKLKVDRFGNKVLDAQGREQFTDLARPEAVAQSVGDALRYLRSSPNPGQDPQAQQHYGTIRAALERSLPVPAYDSNALAARMQAARQAPPAAPAALAQPAPNYGPPAGYGQPQPAYSAPAQPAQNGYAPPSGYVGPAGVPY